MMLYYIVLYCIILYDVWLDLVSLVRSSRLGGSPDDLPGRRGRWCCRGCPADDTNGAQATSQGEGATCRDHL